MGSETEVTKPTAELKPPAWEGSKWPWIVGIIVALLILLAVLNYFFKWVTWGDSPQTVIETITPAAKVPDEPDKTKKQVIAYKKAEKEPDPVQSKLVDDRKKKFGLKKSMDLVVKSDESIKVGDEVIPLKKILDQIRAQEKGLSPKAEAFLKKPEITEEDIGNKDEQKTSRFASPAISGTQKPVTGQKKPAKKPVHYYGIYVVQPGDNLWNIHFAFLIEYFAYKHIPIADTDDEPLAGKSSGIGRILKYAENMVHIFNVKTQLLSDDLNMLEPYEKIVVFNLTHLYNILGPLEKKHLKILRFDGTDLVVVADDE